MKLYRILLTMVCAASALGAVAVVQAPPASASNYCTGTPYNPILFDQSKGELLGQAEAYCTTPMDAVIARARLDWGTLEQAESESAFRNTQYAAAAAAYDCYGLGSTQWRTGAEGSGIWGPSGGIPGSAGSDWQFTGEVTLPCPDTPAVPGTGHWQQGRRTHGDPSTGDRVPRRFRLPFRVQRINPTDRRPAAFARRAAPDRSTGAEPGHADEHSDGVGFGAPVQTGRGQAGLTNRRLRGASVRWARSRTPRRRPVGRPRPDLPTTEGVVGGHSGRGR